MIGKKSDSHIPPSSASCDSHFFSRHLTLSPQGHSPGLDQSLQAGHDLPFTQRSESHFRNHSAFNIEILQCISAWIWALIRFYVVRGTLYARLCEYFPQWCGGEVETLENFKKM